MNATWVGLLGVVLALSAGLVNLIAQDWRKRVMVLALQAIGVFLLCLQSLSLSLALVRFIEGWMAAAILGTAMAAYSSNLRPSSGQLAKFSSLTVNPLSAVVFRLAAAALVGAFVVGGAPYLMSIFNGIRLSQTYAVLGLAGIGLLMLGFRTSIFSISIGLITFLNGFEILLAVIEPSVMLSGLMAVTILGIAFICAYLLYVEGEPKKG